MDKTAGREKIGFSFYSLILVFIFLSLSSSLLFALFGPTILNIERTWNISLEKNSTLVFKAYVGQNNSNQKVLDIVTDPRMDINIIDEKIKVEYNSSGTPENLILKITTRPQIEFKDNLKRDAQFVKANSISYTNLTRANPQMVETAKSLQDPTSDMKTIANLANWVHSNVQYNISYWTKIITAEQVYIDKKGVCVEYTHLFISLAKSLGFEARYVEGFVYSGIEWQPHAWAEVKMTDGTYLAVDPTFGQAGKLDSYHYEIADGDDYQAVYDEILSSSKDIEVKTGQTVLVESEQRSQNLGLTITNSFDEASETEQVEFTNQRDEYVFVTYDFVIQKTYGNSVHEIMVLGPNEKLIKNEKLIDSGFSKGYEYSIPIKILADDIEKDDTIVVKKPNDVESLVTNNSESGCKAAFILIFLIATLEYHKSKIRKVKSTQIE